MGAGGVEAATSWFGGGGGGVLKPQPPDHQSDTHPTEPPGPAYSEVNLANQGLLMNAHMLFLEYLPRYPFYPKTCDTGGSVAPDKRGIQIYTVLIAPEKHHENMPI